MKSMYHSKLVRCIDCTCCDIDEMKCRPKDEDCEKEYDLTEEDLFVPVRCDFFIRKRYS